MCVRGYLRVMHASPITTAAQLLDYEEPGHRHELERGQLRRRPWHGAVTGAAIARLGSLLVTHLDTHRLGLAAAGVGCLLERDPDTVYLASIAFVRRERMPPPDVYDFFHGAPELVAEFVSTHDPDHDGLQARARTWIRCGTRLSWVVDAVARTVDVLRADGSSARLTTADVLRGDRVLPDFAVPVADLFDDFG